jgi:site-specific recombinase XerD
MRDGSLLDRSGKTYKPSTCRSYELAVTKYLKPDPIARMRVTAIQRADVQSFVDRLRRKGLSASTIANKLDPIRVVFRRAIRRVLMEAAIRHEREVDGRAGMASATERPNDRSWH